MSVSELDGLLTCSPMSTLPPSSPPADDQPSSPFALPLPLDTYAAPCTPPPTAVVPTNTIEHQRAHPQLSNDGVGDDEQRDDPPSSDGIIPTSPIVANDNESVQQVRRRKAQKKRVRTLATNQFQREEVRLEALQAIDEENREARVHDEQNTAAARDACFNQVISLLQDAELTWGDFVEWVCEPRTGRGGIRYWGMFSKDGQVERVLNLWAWKNSKSGKSKMQAWATAFMGRVVSKEGKAATADGILMSRRMAITESFVLDFDLQKIHNTIQKRCPSMATLMREFSTTPRQRAAAGKPEKTAREEEIEQKRLDRKNRVREIVYTLSYYDLTTLEESRSSFDRASRRAKSEQQLCQAYNGPIPVRIWRPETSSVGALYRRLLQQLHEPRWEWRHS